MDVEISLPTWAWQTVVIYHEAAHILVFAKHRRTKAAHGWEFVRAFLDIVKTMEGAKAEEELRHAFKAGKVRYYPKRKVLN